MLNVNCVFVGMINSNLHTNTPVTMTRYIAYSKLRKQSVNVLGIHNYRGNFIKRDVIWGQNIRAVTQRSTTYREVNSYVVLATFLQLHSGAI